MTTDPQQWLIDIQSPDDGESNHTIGPFTTEEAALSWREEFIEKYNFDPDFIRVVRHVTWDPKKGMDMMEIDEWYRD